MAIKVICMNLSCKKVFLVKDELQGKKVKCPGCQTILTVGQASKPAPAPVRPKAAPEKKIIRFNCQFCHTPLKAPESAGGKNLTCPQCRRTLMIPRLSSDLILGVAPSQKQVKRRRMISCPQCGRIAAAGNVKCPDCNFSFVNLDAARLMKQQYEKGKIPLDFWQFRTPKPFLLLGALFLLASFVTPLASGMEGGIGGYLFFWNALSGDIVYKIFLFYALAAGIAALATVDLGGFSRGVIVVILGALSFVFSSILTVGATGTVLPESVTGFAGSSAGVFGAAGIFYLVATLASGVVISCNSLVSKVKRAKVLPVRLLCGFGGLLVIAPLLLPAPGSKAVILPALFKGGPLFALFGVAIGIISAVGILRFAPLPAGFSNLLEKWFPFVAVGSFALGTLGVFLAGLPAQNVGPLVSLGFALRATAPVLLVWGGAMLIMSEILVPKAKKAGREVFEPHV